MALEVGGSATVLPAGASNGIMPPQRTPRPLLEGTALRVQHIVSALVALFVVGCGSGSTTPTGPGAPLGGTWVQVSGGTRTWLLEQSGIQAGGTASFASSNYSSVGEVSGSGAVLGVAVIGGLRFAEVYDSLDIPSRPPNNCYLDTDGFLSLKGNTMTGTVTETLGCAGVQVSRVTRDIVMQRK